jgi:hypothetical protein
MNYLGYSRGLEVSGGAPQEDFYSLYLNFNFIAECSATGVSIIQLMFFLKKYQAQQCEWELIFVAICEGNVVFIITYVSIFNLQTHTNY